MTRSLLRSEISNGQAGIRQTADVLSRLAINASADLGVIQVARQVISSVPENDVQGELSALQQYVRSNVRYTGDPAGIPGYPDSGAELVTDPRYLLRDIEQGGMGYGDCDDMCALLAALALSVGHDVRFVTRSNDATGPHTHIFLEAYDRNSDSWWGLDPIVRSSFEDSFRGRLVPGAQQSERFPAMRGMGMITFRDPGLAYTNPAIPTASSVRTASYRGVSGVFDSLVGALPGLIETGADVYMGLEQMKAQEGIAKAQLEQQRAELEYQKQLLAATSAGGGGGALGGFQIDQKTLLIGAAALAAIFFMRKR